MLATFPGWAQMAFCLHQPVVAAAAAVQAFISVMLLPQAPRLMAIFGGSQMKQKCISITTMEILCNGCKQVPIQAQWGQLVQRVKTGYKGYKGNRANLGLKENLGRKESQGLMAEAVLALLGRKVSRVNLARKGHLGNRVYRVIPARKGRPEPPGRKGSRV
jgi:hypothetical protein